jgi:hypothetical protein
MVVSCAPERGGLGYWKYLQQKGHLLEFKRRIVSLVVTAAGVIALFALTSSAAVAAVHWNVSSTLAHWKGSLTVEAEGSSVACSNLDLRVPTLNDKFNNGDYSLTTQNAQMKFACAGSTTMELLHEGSGTFSGTKYELFISAVTGFSLESPLGLYFADPLNLHTMVFTNGSGLTPSKVTFSKTPLGEMELSGEPITISGTLTVTTSTGGLLTLST